MKSKAAIAFVWATAPFAVGCTLMGGGATPPSRVRGGALYASGNPDYDAYFRDVNSVQLSEAEWKSALVSGRAPLASQLHVDADAPDATLAERTHARCAELARASGPLMLELSGGDARVVTRSGAASLSPQAKPLAEALETTAHAELERARRMRATAARIEQILRTGHDLEGRVDADFRNRTSKATDVKNEIGASFEILTPRGVEANMFAEGAENFVLDLKRAIAVAGGGNGRGPRSVSTPGALPSTPVSSSAKGAAAVAASPPSKPGPSATLAVKPSVSAPASAPKPAPAEKAEKAEKPISKPQKPTDDEVFTP